MSKEFIVEKIVVGPIFTNSYLFGCETTKICAVIDPGDDSLLIKERIKKLNLKPECIIVTHGHIDHIGAVGDFDLPVYAGERDRGCFVDSEKNFSSLFGGRKTFNKPSNLLHDRDRVTVGKLYLEAIEVPGHTPGSICLFSGEVLFSGDTIFAGSVGRTDFPEGNHELLVKMIKEKLLVLKDTTKVYPGHGESTTIGIEKRSNPFLG